MASRLYSKHSWWQQLYKINPAQICNIYSSVMYLRLSSSVRRVLGQGGGQRTGKKNLSGSRSLHAQAEASMPWVLRSSSGGSLQKPSTCSAWGQWDLRWIGVLLPLLKRAANQPGKEKFYPSYLCVLAT